VPLYWLIGGQRVVNTISVNEARSLKVFPPFPRIQSRMAVESLLALRFNQANQQYFYQFLDRSFQKKVESASTDQFPFREDGISMTMAADRSIIALVYEPLPDLAFPADMKSSLYVTRDKKFIIYKPDNFSDSTKVEINARIENYESLIKQFPHLHFYLFYHQRLPNSEFDPLNQYFPFADRGQALAYFEENKPEELQMTTMLLSGFEEHKLEYYATDHHWNVVGIRVAYNKAYDLLAQNYQDISPRLNLDTIVTFPEIKMLGSLARESQYPIQPEKFSVFKLNLPQYSEFLDGKPFPYDHKPEYWEGKYSTKKYQDHYIRFYGDQYDILDFVSQNGSTRNLLIIGSSYVRPIVPMLASHYQHTYLIDKRKVTDFSLSSFIQDHPVDDVLFFGDNTVAFTNSLWAVEP
jgi:hypothetical protein